LQRVGRRRVALPQLPRPHQLRAAGPAGGGGADVGNGEVEDGVGGRQRGDADGAGDGALGVQQPRQRRAQQRQRPAPQRAVRHGVLQIEQQQVDGAGRAAQLLLQQPCALRHQVQRCRRALPEAQRPHRQRLRRRRRTLAHKGRLAAGAPRDGRRPAAATTVAAATCHGALPRRRPPPAGWLGRPRPRAPAAAASTTHRRTARLPRPPGPPVPWMHRLPCRLAS